MCGPRHSRTGALCQDERAYCVRLLRGRRMSAYDMTGIDQQDTSAGHAAGCGAFALPLYIHDATAKWPLPPFLGERVTGRMCVAWHGTWLGSLVWGGPPAP